MTLHKSIEAAREAYKKILRTSKRGCKIYTYAEQGIDSLPAKPMTEEEIVKILRNAVTKEDRVDGFCERAVKDLRDAGALYVEEKK